MSTITKYSFLFIPFLKQYNYKTLPFTSMLALGDLPSSLLSSG